MLRKGRRALRKGPVVAEEKSFDLSANIGDHFRKHEGRLFLRQGGLLGTLLILVIRLTVLLEGVPVESLSMTLLVVIACHSLLTATWVVSPAVLCQSAIDLILKLEELLSAAF